MGTRYMIAKADFEELILKGGASMWEEVVYDPVYPYNDPDCEVAYYEERKVVRGAIAGWAFDLGEKWFVGPNIWKDEVDAILAEYAVPYDCV